MHRSWDPRQPSWKVWSTPPNMSSWRLEEDPLCPISPGLTCALTGELLSRETTACPCEAFDSCNRDRVQTTHDFDSSQVIFSGSSVDCRLRPLTFSHAHDACNFAAEMGVESLQALLSHGPQADFKVELVISMCCSQGGCSCRQQAYSRKTIGQIRSLEVKVDSYAHTHCCYPAPHKHICALCVGCSTDFTSFCGHNISSELFVEEQLDVALKPWDTTVEFL